MAAAPAPGSLLLSLVVILSLGAVVLGAFKSEPRRALTMHCIPAQVNGGFHIGDARVKKLTPASIRSIGRHVEFSRAR